MESILLRCKSFALKQLNWRRERKLKLDRQVHRRAGVRLWRAFSLFARCFVCLALALALLDCLLEYLSCRNCNVAATNRREKERKKEGNKQTLFRILED